MKIQMSLSAVFPIADEKDLLSLVREALKRSEIPRSVGRTTSIRGLQNFTNGYTLTKYSGDISLTFYRGITASTDVYEEAVVRELKKLGVSYSLNTGEIRITLKDNIDKATAPIFSKDDLALVSKLVGTRFRLADSIEFAKFETGLKGKTKKAYSTALLDGLLKWSTIRVKPAKVRGRPTPAYTILYKQLVTTPLFDTLR